MPHPVSQLGNALDLLASLTAAALLALSYADASSSPPILLAPAFPSFFTRYGRMINWPRMACRSDVATPQGCQPRPHETAGFDHALGPLRQ
jgi:hypothetical protein